MGRTSAVESVHRAQVETYSALADVATIFGSFFDRLAEVKPDEDARIGVLDRRLREAGIRAEGRCRIAAGATGRQRRATVPEADLVGAEELLKYFGGRSPLNRATRHVLLSRT